MYTFSLKQLHSSKICSTVCYHTLKCFDAVSEHQNYFGVDDNLGPFAVSIKREKLEERENYLGKSETGLYQFRVILRTREVSGLRVNRPLMKRHHWRTFCFFIRENIQ